MAPVTLIQGIRVIDFNAHAFGPIALFKTLNHAAMHLNLDCARMMSCRNCAVPPVVSPPLFH